MYPEYYESYDELGPAHIFELNLTGEGFRARQCFKEGVILLNAYDEIFPTGVCGGVRRGAYPDGVEPLICCMWAVTGGKGRL